MKRNTESKVAIAASAGIVALAAAAWFSRRSHVDTEELGVLQPGDDIIGEAAYVCDRATIIDATAEEIWPWLIQLGKDRAGWYAPSWLEKTLMLRSGQRSTRTIRPELQQLKEGDVIPDWGPGSLLVERMRPPHTIVFAAIHDDTEAIIFSWAHTIEYLGNGRSRLYSRLRFNRPNSKMKTALLPLGGLFDYATSEVFYAGLKENIERQRKRSIRDSLQSG